MPRLTRVEWGVIRRYTSSFDKSNLFMFTILSLYNVNDVNVNAVLLVNQGDFQSSF